MRRCTRSSANLVVAIVLSLVFNAMKVSNGKDTTTATDYEEQPVAVGRRFVDRRRW